MSRRTYWTIRLVVLCVLLVVLLAAIGAGAAAGLLGGGAVLRGEPAAQAEFSGITALDIRVGSCSVRAMVWDGDTVQAVYYAPGLLRTGEPEMTQAGATLSVSAPAASGIFSLLGGRLELRLPAGLAADCTIRSGSGSVDWDAPMSDGTVEVGSGSVKVRRGGDSLTITTGAGSVKVYAPFRSLTVDSGTGSVKAVAGPESRTVSVAADTGSVKLALENVTGYTWRHTTGAGSVKDEYRDWKAEDDGETVWGDGSLAIVTDCGTGSTKLTDWND